jgi:hypothetical protein
MRKTLLILALSFLSPTWASDLNSSNDVKAYYSQGLQPDSHYLYEKHLHLGFNATPWLSQKVDVKPFPSLTEMAKRFRNPEGSPLPLPPIPLPGPQEIPPSQVSCIQPLPSPESTVKEALIFSFDDL